MKTAILIVRAEEFFARDERMQLVTGFGSVSLCFSSSDIEHVFAIRLRDPWRFVLRAGTLDPRSTEKEIENRLSAIAYEN